MSEFKIGDKVKDKELEEDYIVTDIIDDVRNGVICKTVNYDCNYKIGFHPEELFKTDKKTLIKNKIRRIRIEEAQLRKLKQELKQLESN